MQGNADSKFILYLHILVPLKEFLYLYLYLYLYRSPADLLKVINEGWISLVRSHISAIHDSNSNDGNRNTSSTFSDLTDLNMDVWNVGTGTGNAEQILESVEQRHCIKLTITSSIFTCKFVDSMQ